MGQLWDACAKGCKRKPHATSMNLVDIWHFQFMPLESGLTCSDYVPIGSSPCMSFCVIFWTCRCMSALDCSYSSSHIPGFSLTVLIQSGDLRIADVAFIQGRDWGGDNANNYRPVKGLEHVWKLWVGRICGTGELQGARLNLKLYFCSTDLRKVVVDTSRLPGCKDVPLNPAGLTSE